MPDLHAKHAPPTVGAHDAVETALTADFDPEPTLTANPQIPANGMDRLLSQLG
jgi:hypothetical protein